jgi:hypothetical protein
MKINCSIHTLNWGFIGLLSGGLLYHSCKDLYNKKYTPLKMKNFFYKTNWGAYLGLGVGLFYGCTKTPLLYYFLKKN